MEWKGDLSRNGANWPKGCLLPLSLSLSLSLSRLSFSPVRTHLSFLYSLLSFPNMASLSPVPPSATPSWPASPVQLALAQGLAGTADASSAIDSAAPATMAPSFRDLGSSSMTAWHGHNAWLSPVPAPDQLWSERTTTPTHEDVVGGTWLAVPVGAPTCAGTHIAPILCQKNEHWLARCPQVGSIETAPTSEISGQSHVNVPAAKTGRRRGVQIAGRRTPDSLEPNDKHVQYPRQLRRQPSRPYKRAISSVMALRWLHIPADMHRHCA